MTRGLLCFSLCLFPGMYAMSDDYNTDISDELLRLYPENSYDFSLRHYITDNESATTTHPSRELEAADTILATFTCQSFSLTIDYPPIKELQNAVVTIRLYKIVDGVRRACHTQSWSFSKNSDNRYMASEPIEDESVILFPGNYIVEYTGFTDDDGGAVEYPDTNIKDEELGIKPFTSIGICTHSDITLLVECSSPNRGSIIPAPESISSSYASGAPSGGFQVSEGAATYTLPINMPKHILTPDIGLTYNSFTTGYGLAGYGVNIKGLSSISRTGKDLYHDGESRGVSYTDTDNLLLDGKRLVLVSGNHGQDGAVYSPENDPFTVITLNGSGQSVWFEVTTSDGMTYEYGRSATSRNNYVNSKGLGRTASWHLSLIKDHNGNYATFDYDRENLTLYPTLISYGMNNSVANSNVVSTVAFEYQSLGDNSRKFMIEDCAGSINRCIKSVTTSTAGNVYRKYLLTYDSTSDNSTGRFTRLTSIDVQNGSGSKLAPVIFRWNPTPAPSTSAYILNAATENNTSYIKEINRNFMSSDLNGDGVSDIIRVSFVKVITDVTPGGSSFTHRTYVYISLSEVSPSGAISYNEAAPIVLPESGDHANISSMLCGSTVADFDGDGYNDIFVPYLHNIQSLHYITYHIISSKKIDNSFVKKDIPYSIALKSNEAPLYCINDIDGDGKDEIIYLDYYNDATGYSGGIVNHTDNTDASNNTVKWKLPSWPKKMFCFDCNNDGLPDIIFLHESGYKIYYNSGGNDADAHFSETKCAVGTAFSNHVCIAPGDFNGDGLTDFVYATGKDQYLYTALNKGNGTFSIIKSDITGVTLSDKAESCSMTVCDIDHDGLSDVLVAVAGSSDTKTRWLYSDGTKLKLISEYSCSNVSSASRSHIFTGDFDGDGAFEIINCGSQLNTNQKIAPVSGFNVYRTSSTFFSESKIRFINDGSGAGISITFAPMSKPSIYTGEKSSSYPVNSYTIPLSLVSSTSRNIGNSRRIKHDYTYSDLKIHVTGRGLLGFSSVTDECPTLNTAVISKTTSRDNVHYVPLTTEHKEVAGNDTMTVTTTFAINAVGNNFYSHPSSSVTVDYDGNVTSTAYTFDSTKGVMTEQTTNYDNTSMYETTVYAGYARHGGKWLPSSVTKRRKHKDDNNVFSAKTLYEYDSHGNVTSMTEHAGTPQALKSSFTHDTYGNITSTRSTGTGVAPVTIYEVYDAAGRNKIKQYTSPASSVTQYTYDHFGNMLTETDITIQSRPITRKFTYDGWNRPLSVTKPDGTAINYIRGWGAVDEYRYFVKSVESDGTTTVTWYDILGRETLVRSSAPGDITVAKASRHGINGLVSLIENHTGSLYTTTSYAYDRRGRIVSESFSNGKSRNYSYGNRSVTTDKNGRLRTVVNDAWGNVKSSTDPVSSVTYTYNSNGYPSKASSSGSTVTMAYDGAANRISMNDPDAGTTTYTYAADGSVLSQTDARGVTLTNTYDNLGRLSQRMTGDITTDYTYGTEGNSLNRLVRESVTGAAIAYTYDAYGRVLTTSHELAAKGTFTVTNEYNTDGQLSKATYPGGLIVEYEYDINGFMCAIKANNSEVWRLDSNDGITARSVALGTLITTRTLDSNGYPSSLDVERDPFVKGRRYSESIALGYDGATGNIISSSMSGRESYGFGYDELDRLVSVSTGKEVMTDIAYADNGNIIYKTGIGEYRYDSSKPHAVTEVDNTDGIIPSASISTDFNDAGMVSRIASGRLEMTFLYGPDGRRCISTLTNGGTTVRETIYAGNYEKITEQGATREFYYLEGNIIIVKSDGVFTPYYSFVDAQGSIVSVVDAEGNKVFSAEYDVWGVPHIGLNSIGLQRGYSGHEHHHEFGIINMNGRLYDPVLGRFFSIDNYVQAPTESQSFNRYSYCLNNPLKYRDASGEWFGIDDLLVSAISAVTGYLQSGFTTGHWGMSSIKRGISAGLSGWIGYNTCGAGAGLLGGSVGSYLKYSVANCIANHPMLSIPIPINNNVNLSLSPAFSLGANGLTAGVSAMASMQFGDWGFSLSAGAGNKYVGGDFAFSYDGWGAGYGLTHYYSETVQGNRLGSQNVGTISLLLRGVSIRVSNDLFGNKKHDRWRSSAVEIGFKDFTIGTYVTTNNGKKESNNNVNSKAEAPIWGENNDDKNGDSLGAWEKGEVFSAPFWIGFKSGNQIQRIGFSHKVVQNITQNGVHKGFAHTPYFLGYNYFNKGIFYQSGYNSPISIW